MYFYYIKRRGGRPARRYLVKGAYRRALFHNEVDLKANLIQMAFYMRHYLKLAYNDIARLLGISVSTAYRWIKEEYMIRYGTLPWDDIRRRPRRYKGLSIYKYMPLKPIREMWKLYEYVATTSRYAFNLKGVMENWLRNIDEPPRPMILLDLGYMVYAVPDYSIEAYVELMRREATKKLLTDIVVAESLKDEMNKQWTPEISIKILRMNMWENPAFSRNTANKMEDNKYNPRNIMEHHGTIPYRDAPERAHYTQLLSHLPPPMT